MKTDKINAIVDALWKDPNEKNWQKFASTLKNSKLRYYKVIFQRKDSLKKLDDLKDSYVEIYDDKYKLACKVPLVKKDAKKLRGATIYLMGLLNLNK